MACCEYRYQTGEKEGRGSRGREDVGLSKGMILLRRTRSQS